MSRKKGSLNKKTIIKHKYADLLSSKLKKTLSGEIGKLVGFTIKSSRNIKKTI
jgi:hypothetical protein